ncbi:unnamed protein product, partial [Polarella glacialis]
GAVVLATPSSSLLPLLLMAVEADVRGTQAAALHSPQLEARAGSKTETSRPPGGWKEGARQEEPPDDEHEHVVARPPNPHAHQPHSDLIASAVTVVEVGRSPSKLSTDAPEERWSATRAALFGFVCTSGNCAQNGGTTMDAKSIPGSPADFRSDLLVAFEGQADLPKSPAITVLSLTAAKAKNSRCGGAASAAATTTRKAGAKSPTPPLTQKPLPSALPFSGRYPSGALAEPSRSARGSTSQEMASLWKARPRLKEAPAAVASSQAKGPGNSASASSRSMKFYPQPLDSRNSVPVDVIEHASELLIIRRESSPSPRCPPQRLLRLPAGEGNASPTSSPFKPQGRQASPEEVITM